MSNMAPPQQHVYMYIVRTQFLVPLIDHNRQARYFFVLCRTESQMGHTSCMSWKALGICHLGHNALHTTSVERPRESPQHADRVALPGREGRSLFERSALERGNGDGSTDDAYAGGADAKRGGSSPGSGSGSGSSVGHIIGIVVGIAVGMLAAGVAGKQTCSITGRLAFHQAPGTADSFGHQPGYRKAGTALHLHSMLVVPLAFLQSPPTHVHMVPRLANMLLVYVPPPPPLPPVGATHTLDILQGQWLCMTSFQPLPYTRYMCILAVGSFQVHAKLACFA